MTRWYIQNTNGNSLLYSATDNEPLYFNKKTEAQLYLSEVGNEFCDNIRDFFITNRKPKNDKRKFYGKSDQIV
jgi:hypothetical protein